MGMLTLEHMQTALDWAYDTSLRGLPSLGTAIDLAEDYRRKGGCAFDQANALIKRQTAKSATAGFITGLGGLATLPLAVPANITSVLYLQIRMVAAIAHLGERDLEDERVRSLIYMTLCGSSATDVVRDMGIKLGKRLTEKAIDHLSKETIAAINKAVGFQLVAKFGQAGLINLSKVVPVVGGIIGGAIDGAATRTIGTLARDTFIAPGPGIMPDPDGTW